MHVDINRGVFLASGPYGVGKDTLLGELIAMFPDRIHRVRTLTTRPTSPDADPSYRTVSIDEMKRLTSAGGWVVNQQFSGTVHYATSLDEIEDHIRQGHVCVHSIFAGPLGAGRMREVFGKRLFAVGLLATAGGLSDQLDVLRLRLKARTRDDGDALNARIQHQTDPIRYVLENPVVQTPDGPMKVFDSISINDDLQRTVADLTARFTEFFNLEKVNELNGQRSDADLIIESTRRAHPGGAYFNPAITVLEKCRKIEIADGLRTSPALMNLDGGPGRTFHISKLYASLTRALVDDELLFAVYRRNSYLLAPYLFDEERCSDFEVQAYDGYLTTVGYYAVPSGLADEGMLRDFTG